MALTLIENQRPSDSGASNSRLSWRLELGRGRLWDGSRVDKKEEFLFLLFFFGSHSCRVTGPGEHRRSTKPHILMYTAHSREPLEIDNNNMHGVFFVEAM